jgi:protein-tyrosine-phosphatase
MTAGAALAPRVLFVCTGNTCRSVLAEYLGRQLFGGDVLFESAGVRPQSPRDAENAVYTLLKNFDIDASLHAPRDVRGLDLTKYELIIALEKSVAKVIKELGVSDEKVRLWRIRDPWGPDLTEYDLAALEIKKRLVQLKASTSKGEAV